MLVPKQIPFPFYVCLCICACVCVCSGVRVCASERAFRKGRPVIKIHRSFSFTCLLDKREFDVCLHVPCGTSGEAERERNIRAIEECLNV